MKSKKGTILTNSKITFAKYEEIETPCKKMCGTCAYRRPVSELEKEAEYDIFVERGNQPHACHEDHQYYCRGNWELTKKMGLHNG